MRSFRQPECSPGFLISLACILLFLPLRWFLALFISAAFHELCHLLALRLCGGQVHQLRLGSFGAVIHATPLSPAKALLCSLAGPAGGLLLIFFARWFPRLALCAAIQSAYNLLPIHGLDGSHALRFFLGMFLPEEVLIPLCIIIERILLILVCSLALYATFIVRLGILPVLAAGSLILKATGGKIPCKTGSLRVQ